MGQIIYPSGVRNFFTPFLTSSQYDQSALERKIESVERYVSDVWYEGSYPAKGRVPCLLLTAANIILDPTLPSDTFREIKKIGDVTYDVGIRGGTTIDELSKSWKATAEAILRAQAEHQWKLYLAND